MLFTGNASAATLHVWPDSPNPMPPYDSWANAATNIQAAVDAAQPGDLVLVTNGVYATGGRAVSSTTNRVVVDKAVTLQSVNGPVETVIDAANSARCVYVGTNAILSGFTLTSGNAEIGGGAWCESSAILTNCVVTGNSAWTGGGASGGTLNNCTLTNNSAFLGGGASGWESGCTLSNCIVTGNSATFGGGAYHSTLYNSTVTYNTAVNVLSLEAYGSGGGVYESVLYNCTLSGNSSDNSGGGASGGTLYNCIVYFNSLANYFGSGANYSGSTLNYSCTTPMPTDGTNNITVDPQMLTLTHLSVSSPCIGAGSSAYATGVDIDGEPWADPPCIGADQLTPGQATGALTMAIEAQDTNVAPGIGVRFEAQNQGPILTSVWDFDDGTFLTNQPIAEHAWSAPGSYTVRLTGYNDSFPAGVTTPIQIEVSEKVYYVNQANPTPVFPYTSWATAATNIQDGIDAGTLRGRLVLVTNGVYASGSVVENPFSLISGAGSNRIALISDVVVRSVNGPEVTVIQGAPGIRCAYLGPGTILSGFTLTNGYANNGGGAWSEGILTNCFVTGNSANSRGGGVALGVVYNCTLTGNSADLGGGACFGGLRNCTLSGNSANYGGGSYKGTLNNCTLTGNSALYEGGGACGGTLNNCIVFYNSAPDSPNYDGSALNYSCTTPLPAGPGNIDSEPLLASSSHLSPQSPCIGQGSNAYASGVDIDGEPWADPPCMGADQLTPGQATGPLAMAIQAAHTTTVLGFPLTFGADIQGPILSSVWDFGDGTLVTNQPLASHSWSVPGTYTVRLTGYNDSFPDGVTATLQVQVGDSVYDVSYVNQANSTPLFPYASWQTAATNIQDAILAAATIGRLVQVTNGVYASGSVEAQGANRIALTCPVEVQSVNGPGVTVIAGAAGIRCAYVGRNAILSGFTLTDGNNAESGGGAWCEPSAILTNCVVAGNSAHDGGGAYGGTLNHCTLSGNSADSEGGGAHSATLYNCTLSGNSAAQGGGAFEYDSGCTLYDCTLSGNSAAAGGGVYYGTLYNCTLTGNTATSGGGVAGGTLYNCTLTGNSAQDGGGAFTGSLYNCTVTGNSAQDGGGVFWSTLYNCIVYFNSAPYGPNYTTNSLNSTNFHYSCTMPLPTNGVGNIDAEPRFVDAANGDFRLRPGSLCIDAGTNLLGLITTDITGLPRPLDGNYDGVAQFDMGAYEFNPIGSEPIPERLGSYDTSGYATDVAVMGNYAYVADGEAGLQVIDISDPTNTIWLGGIDIEGNAVGVAVSSNYAYLADGDAGLQIINVSNPANPQRVGGYDTSGSATDVTLAGNYAYVADGDAGLQIIDVSNPANPQRVGGYQTSGSAYGVVVSSNYVYVAYGKAPSDGGLEVVDIGNPASPAQVGAIDSLGFARGVTLAGDYAYVATDLGLEVVDVSNPAGPARAGGYDTAGEIYDVTVADIFAYVVNPALGLVVLDVSDPRDPQPVAGNSSFSASGVTVDGDKVFAAAGEDGLIILNQYVWLRIGPAVVTQNGQLRLSLQGADGQCVCVQRSTDLVHWEDWKIVTLGADGCELTDDTTAAAQMFYRVVKEQMQVKNLEP